MADLPTFTLGNWQYHWLQDKGYILSSKEYIKVVESQFNLAFTINKHVFHFVQVKGNLLIKNLFWKH
jgi:hypothetical protein